jgi:hypothetical protein
MYSQNLKKYVILKEKVIIPQDLMKPSQELWNIENLLKIKKLNYDVIVYHQIIYFICFVTII